MNVADFEDLLDRLGEDIATWPAALQPAATALLSSSDQARALLDEARLLRRALSATPIRADADLTDRIMRSIHQAPTAATPAADPVPAEGTVRIRR